MNLKINRSILLYLIVGNLSCHSPYTFKYWQHKDEYQRAIKCIRGHFNTIFLPGDLKEMNSLYIDDIKDFGCNDIANLFKRQSIQFVTIGKDTTICFYSTSEELLRGKQHILAFVANKEKFLKELPSNITIVNAISDSCYELEKIISVAD